MTSKQLNAALTKWQKRLRIQDWDIELEVVDRSTIIDKADSDVLGACQCFDTKKRAQILLLRPEDIKPGEDNIEVILVHELLHVVMPVQDLRLNIDQKDPAYIAYERIVDQMARAFVAAYEE
tara:strand:- start:984 stop:1349 length:366 start_codon:yes stop_codon:yes gene_type:complete